MLRSILGKEELFEKIVYVIRKVLGDDVVGIVLFGSSVYMGMGRDIDLLVVIRRDIDVKEKLRLELEIARELRNDISRDRIFDVHVMSLKDFEQNLAPGSFLMGLALGYRVLLDKAGIEDRILDFLQKIASERYVLHNEYGTWNLSHFAYTTAKLGLKRKRRELEKPSYRNRYEYPGT